MNFLPLKYYYRSLFIALLVPLIVAFLLCLHLYNIKLERAVEKREADFANVSAQVNHGMESVNGLLSSMFNLYQRPISAQINQTLLEGINQYSGYYYRHFNVQGTEIIGKGEFSLSAEALLQWQQVFSLGPSFNTTLALMQSLSAVAYVDENDFAYVSRRNKSQSLMLSEILNGKFKPKFSPNRLTSSPIIKINDKSYFAIGRQRDIGSSDYIILIYDVQAISAWLSKVSPSSGEYVFMNQSHQIIASSKNVIEKAVQLESYWPNLVEHTKEATVLASNSNFFMQPMADLPIHAAYYEPKPQFVSSIKYEILLEFVFLTLFLSMMFAVFFWLSQRIFVKPMTHLMHFLESNNAQLNNKLNYNVPLSWQPWFSKVKTVFSKNEQLVNSLKNANKALDEQVQRQSEKLSRSYEAKERHLALLNTMLNSVPDLIYFKNIDGTFLGCNRAFEAYIGKDQTTLIGMRVDDFGENDQQINTLEKQVLKNRNSVEQRIDTDTKSYQLTIAPFYNEHQHLLGTMGIGRDITEQQQTLHALKASESKFRSAIEFAANCVVLLSLEHTIVQVNKATRKQFSEQNTLVGEPLKTLFDESQWQQIKDALAQLLDDKKRVYHLTLSQGKLASWLQLSMSLVWDENRDPAYYVIHIQDVSALTKAKHDAERATLAKSRFIANLSHEIRTPLNAVLGLLDMLIEQGLNQKQLQHTDQAKNAAQSLLLMLNRMLDFARIESAQTDLKLAPFSVIELVDICESLTGPLCEGKGIEFIIDIDPLIAPDLICDSIRLQQILGNLLTNAVKFTHTGSITLKMELIESDSLDQQYICFKVIDTGMGIDEADQRRLFDAFTQGDESSTRIHQGVGLGLAIVKHAVSLMGGEIALKSKKGHGCEFSFSISLLVDSSKNKMLPRNALAILSEQSKELEHVTNAYSELANISLDEVLKYPIKLSNTQQIIVDANDLPELLKVEVINDSLSAKEVSVIIVNHQHTLNLPTSEHLAAKHVKASALGQRLFSLSSLIEPKTDINTVLQNVPELKADISGLLVLAIDDNQLNLEIISSVLRQANINVVTALSASIGMELLQVLKPDLILMDVQMPHIDGCQATTLIRQQFDAKQLPIFALTAHCEPADIERSLKCGMNKHLTKPVVAKVLIDAIADLNLVKPSFFERSFALSQFSLDETLLNTMIGKFANLCETQLAQIAETTSKDDLVRLVHSIKGVAGNLGFRRLSHCALVCERNLKTTNEPVETTLKELIMQLEQVIVFINGLGEKDVEKS
ncbi:PAS domain-containing hybrid sensor histidine kinase/response regulator [Pseudoalteromonas carrageenovora]|uniref:PAS domain-containing hybrid sensor histidine kinase/response regulator n=1 Tax=Pseudoalteromonas carrageenovora TaxID=227 RepID=UPI0026E3F3FE|nr:ATP-binding protein [Pseudoalteromonas carrageenovora]MDO6465576.1 ATP-binding protein [Pseudoalteromonas carrageenovora]